MSEKRSPFPLSLFLDLRYVLHALKTSGLIIAIGIMTGAMLLYFSHIFSIRSFESEILQHAGIAILIGAISVFFIEWSGGVKETHRFIDVDLPSRSKQDERQLVDALLQEIRSLKDQREVPDYDKILEDGLHKALASASHAGQADLQSFASYFGHITALLGEKADVADRKASILLDKGIAYTKFGIAFFVISIAAWQLLAWSGGFKVQFAYGIASCSLLFIFIEFLSAWFLKQYRRFIDTSTFLIKLKAIFDKYMLIYILSKEYPPESQSGQESARSLLGVLAQDIGWPDSYIFDGKDLSFAKETVEALAMFAQQLKVGTRSKESST